jgi:hypothetical protein
MNRDRPLDCAPQQGSRAAGADVGFESLQAEDTPPVSGSRSASLPEKGDVDRQFAKPRLRRWEAALYLQLLYGLNTANATLAKMACTGGGPPFQRAGRIPLYPRDGLDHWAAERLGPIVHSTSEADAKTKSARSARTCSHKSPGIDHDNGIRPPLLSPSHTSAKSQENV